MLNPIAQPEVLPEGAIAVDRIRPVSPRVIEKAVDNLMAAWNTAQLGELISDRFYDKDRLLDNIAAFVPRDATVRVLGVQSSDTVSQYILPNQLDPNRAMRISKVVVNVRTQVEYTDANGQLQRLDGLNEYTFEVEQRLRKK